MQRIQPWLLSLSSNESIAQNEQYMSQLGVLSDPLGQRRLTAAETLDLSLPKCQSWFLSRSTSGMNKRIRMHLVSGKTCYLITITSILFVLAGRLDNAGAQSLTNLYYFGSSPSDGGSPYAGLVQGGNGDFYGTTLSGGTSNFGTVF